MNIDRVITYIRHEKRRGVDVVSDFFITDAKVQEAAHMIGILNADAQVMNTLLWWAQNQDSSDFVFLISVDGKYAYITSRDFIDKPDSQNQLIKLQNEISVDLLNPRQPIVDALQADPELASRLNLGLKAKTIPDRFTAETVPANFSIEEFASGLAGVNAVLENTTDDNLVWLALAGVNGGDGFTPDFNTAVRSELRLRIDKSMNFQATFFPLDSVSEREIDARAERAGRSIEAFNRKFPRNGNLLDHDKLFRYVEKLSTDALAELTVVRYFTPFGFDEQTKALGAALQVRLGQIAN